MAQVSCAQVHVFSSVAASFRWFWKIALVLWSIQIEFTDWLTLHCLA
jgi:hypothetical protein